LNTILDIGCGSNPRGNLNLDLYQGTSVHHKYDYNPIDIEKFVNGDGSRLPYRDKSIDFIVSRHCLEHIPEPLRAIEDWARVARKGVVIMVPNNPTIEEFPAHLYSWSLISFKTFLSQVFPKVEVWANSPIHDLTKNRLINRILRIRLIKKPLQRFISRLLGLQITAICSCERYGKADISLHHINNVEIPQELYPIMYD
jgi:SAM-dependent methyltransferase